MQEWKDIWEKENYVRIPIRVGNLTWPTNSTPIEEEQIQVYSSFQVVAIAVISGFFSFLTILGNIMVMISFKLDKQLQTISNYFLFSLAVADFTIGVFSMPMFTVYTIVGFWPFEPFVCDTWLAVDYLVSNASVMNLLIISFDRYFSVTRPLSYRARRTTRKAATMITSAWVLSLIIWVPWIYAWPYIEGIERTVEEKAECVVQFLDKNIALNVLCAMAAFFLPATIMCGLYLRVWWETVKRQRDLVHLQAGKKMSSKRSDSSEEYGDSKIQDLGGLTLVKTGNKLLLHEEERRRSRIPLPIQNIISRLRGEEIQETREVIPLNPPDTVPNPGPATIDGSAPRQYYPQENGCAGDVYTILIQLPNAKREKDPETASIRILSETSLNELSKSDRSLRHSLGGLNRLESTDSSLYSLNSPTRERKQSLNSLSRNRKHSLEDRLSLDTRIVSKQYVRTIQNPAPTPASTLPRKNKVKKASQEKRQERKAAKTLSAILIVFIVTWTPYNVLAVMKGFISEETEEELIPGPLWSFFYYLCYLNSTINPFCYALCNAAFRRTYMRILTCKWKGSKKQPVQKFYYG